MTDRFICFIGGDFIEKEYDGDNEQVDDDDEEDSSSSSDDNCEMYSYMVYTRFAELLNMTF